MSWIVVVQRPAKKELAMLSSEMQLRLGRALRGLEVEPFPASCKRLRGREEFRLRVDDYRVLYTVDHEHKMVTVAAIGHRREIYR